MKKIPFKDSKVGQWLKTNIPSAITLVEGFVPAPVKGALELVKNLISTDPTLTAEQKEEGLKLAAQQELDILKENDAADQDDRTNITERWKIDVTGDNWLSKNIRPMTLAYLLILFTINVILEACKIHIDEFSKNTLRILLLLVFGAYFGDRALQKYTINKQQ